MKLNSRHKCCHISPYHFDCLLINYRAEATRFLHFAIQLLFAMQLVKALFLRFFPGRLCAADYSGYNYYADSMSAVGDRIRERRVELGWTQNELAEKARISSGFLSDLETGKRNVSADNLLSIAQALSVTLDFLMKGDSSKPKSGEVKIPASLVEFAKQEHLSFPHTLMLLEMRLQIKAHRSNSKSDDLEIFDWKPFYEAVKSFLK